MSECRCGKPTRDDAYVCDQCVTELDKALGDVPWLDEQLEVSITRQKAAALGSGARAATTPLPWHEKASEARRGLHALLVSWVLFCTEEQVRGRPSKDAEDDLPSLSAWLLNVTRGLALHDIGPEAVDEITDAVAECHRVVFWKRRNRVYLGKCEQVVKDEDDVVVTLSCEGDVYANEGDQVGECEQCGQGVTVVIRKADLDKRLDDRLCTAADLASMAVFLGLDVPRERVRKKVLYWHRHKRIQQRSTDVTTEAPMFRYGEVKALLYSEFGRAS